MRRVKVQKKEREAAFVAAETTVFVSQPRGTRATNVKQTKTRGTSVHRRVRAAVEQESDSGASQEEGYKHKVLLRAHTRTMEAQ